MTTVYCSRCEKGPATPVVRLGPGFGGERVQEVSMLCITCSSRGSHESLAAKRRSTPRPMWSEGWDTLAHWLTTRGGLQA